MPTWTGFILILAVLLLWVAPICEFLSKFRLFKRKYLNLRIIGETAPERIDLIKQALDRLPEKFSQSLRLAHIRSDKEHLLFYYGGEKREAIGHRCGQENIQKICIQTADLSLYVIWHEVTHVFTDVVEGATELKDRWLVVAGDVYTEKYEDYYSTDPDNGFLINYGRWNYWEDIAVFVGHCYVYLYVNKNHSVFANKNFKTDERYRKKLDLLYQYGFFSTEDYKKLKPLFE